MRLVFATAAAVAVFASCVFAQFDTGQISGFVKDPSDAVLVGATVVVINEGNRDQHQTTTNQTGYYAFPNLPVGTYTVSAELTGFKKSVQTGIVLNSAAKVNADMQMSVGAMAETVEVQASAAQ